MLDALRKGAGTWVAKIFIGLLVLSFAIWGVADMVVGENTSSVATVGDTDIPGYRFERAYLTQMRQLGRRMGRALTPQEAASLGLPSRILSQLVTEATLNDTAKNLKLGVSDEEMAKALAKDERFHDPTGRFDRNYFNMLLRENGINEDIFLADQRNTALRNQVAEGLIGGMGVSNTYLDAVNQYRNEERVISYISISRDQAGETADPSAGDLDAFFQERKADFKAPEYRKLVLMKVEPEDIIKPEDVAEDDVKKAFADGTKYVEAEKREVQQIVFPSRDEADAARKKITEGATFIDIATDRGLKESDYSLGLVEKSAVIDKAVGEAVFTLEEGKVSEVIEGRFGFVLARAARIQPEVRKPFEDVADAIRKDLAIAKAEEEIRDLLNEIEDTRAGGATLSEAADRFKLNVWTVDAVSAAGLDPKDEQVTSIPERNAVLSKAFESDVGIENDPIRIGNRGYVWFEVAGVTPSRDRTLDEIRDKVIAAYKDDQVQKSLGIKATDATKRLKSGESIETVAADMGLEVKTSGRLRRQGQNQGVSSTVVTAAFSGPEGTVASAQESDNERVVFVVSEIFQPALFAEAEGMDEAAQALAEQISDTILVQYITKQQSDLGISVNQQLLDRIVNPPSNQ